MGHSPGETETRQTWSHPASHLELFNNKLEELGPARNTPLGSGGNGGAAEKDEAAERDEATLDSRRGASARKPTGRPNL